MKQLILTTLSACLLAACSPWHFIPTPTPEITIPEGSPVGIVEELSDVWLWYPTEEERNMLQHWWENIRNIGVREYWPHAPGRISVYAHPGIIIHFSPYSDKHIDFSYMGSLYLRHTTEADRRLRQYILGIMQSRKALPESSASEWEKYWRARYGNYIFTQWQKKYPSVR